MNWSPKFVNQILSASPWSENINETLSVISFEDPRKSWGHLTTLAVEVNFYDLYPDFFPRFLEILSKSYEPDVALINFLRLSEQTPDKNYFYTLLCGSENLLQNLLVMFSGSQTLTDTLLQTPANFDWLNKPNTLSKPKSKDTLFRDFYAMAGENFPPDKTPSLLRKFKKREYIRIGLRDLLNLTDLKENVQDLSNLADVCLQIAYEYANNILQKKYGTPMHQEPGGEWQESKFSVIGLGKLGGRELNYSSDIDLIYIYTSSMGETKWQGKTGLTGLIISNHEYFTRLGQLLTKIIHEITTEGYVFRVDLDLRPEGKSGELANSLISCETYYQSWGKTWERQALIKGRVSAGSESLGKEFFSMLEPFIFRKNLDFDAIEEIKEMKQKIDARLKHKNIDPENIKLGFGGIREVEFIVQAYQLIFGGRHNKLRVPNTIDAIECLYETGFFKKEERDRLKSTYIFLRKLENRLQMSFGLQTHSLPKKGKDLAVIARKMGIRNNDQEATIDTLKEQLRAHTNYVGQFFTNLFVENKKREATKRISNQWLKDSIVEKNFNEDNIKSVPFSDPKRALQFLKSLRDGPQFYHPSAKSIDYFYRLLPKILYACSVAPQPNRVLENLLKFVESTKAREGWFHLFLENEKILELLLVLFGSSDSLSQTLIRNPEVMDIILEPEQIYSYKQPDKIAKKLKTGLERIEGLEEKQNYLRRFKKEEELRIGLRYLIHEADLSGTLIDLSKLADIFLNGALEVAKTETARQFGIKPGDLESFAVFGLGKLGGCELNFGSDLDIVFLYDEPETVLSSHNAQDVSTWYIFLAQTLYRLATEQTAIGFAYKIDCNLRPEGNQTHLAISLEGYRNYFEHRARVWEQQAMVRLRFVAGNESLGRKFIESAHAFAYKPKLKYGSIIEIARLRERMEKELAKEFHKGKDLKKGFGGLSDIEFVTQILQLMHGYQTPRLRQTNTKNALEMLSIAGWLDQSQAVQLIENYLFMRNLECVLRIQNLSSSSRLPQSKDELEVLAKLLGYPGDDDLAKKLLLDYDTATRTIRSIYTKIIDGLLRISVS